MEFFKYILIFVIKLFKKILISNPGIRTFLYDLLNKKEFSDLYEHEKMLADSVRVNNYKLAIEKHVGANDMVLDLGTGTGILSFFAAKQKPKKIYAIDHSEFIQIAEKIAKQNKIDVIEFVKVSSRRFNPNVKFDVIIHEQIGDYLFNENMIQNILDLKRRLLKVNGKILPGKFELFLEPTCLEEPFNIPFIWENKIYGIDFEFLRSHFEALEEFKPDDYKQEWLESSAVKDFLCESKPIFSFDLNQMNSEKEIPQSIEIKRQVISPGRFDGFCLFFKVIFDDEINFETSPLRPNTHWGNCFFRIESRTCTGGQVIKYKLNMPDLLDIKTWSVSIKRFQEMDSRLN
jgi:protein arginine N-methyltransferase 1